MKTRYSDMHQALCGDMKGMWPLKPCFAISFSMINAAYPHLFGMCLLNIECLHVYVCAFNLGSLSNYSWL